MWVFVSQCRGRQDWSLHHPQHRAGEDEVRRCGGHLPDGEDAPHPAARHGADRGIDNSPTLNPSHTKLFGSQWGSCRTVI